nr:hypothetical protein GCM10020092_096150 [Actinoplanes digitatis]
MRAALVGLAQELKLPEARDLDSTLGAVRDALSRGEPHRNWLIVFANANRPEDIRPYLPDGAGHVLITSRNPRWTAEVAQAVPVAAFDRTDSVDLLRRRGPELSAADAELLAERLADVPMALDQAAAVRKATGWTAAEYLRRYDERSAELAFPTPIRVAWGGCPPTRCPRPRRPPTSCSSSPRSWPAPRCRGSCSGPPGAGSRPSWTTRSASSGGSRPRCA